MTSWESVTAVKALTPQTYAVNLDNDWCIGTVPNGGYAASVILSAVREHFSTTLSHLDQPDTMIAQLQFLRRTHAGPGLVTIIHEKLGGTISAIRATLSQSSSSSSSRDEITAFINQTNFSKQESQPGGALTLPTTFTTSAMVPTLPPADLAVLALEGSDQNWALNPQLPNPGFRRATKHLTYYHPKRPDSSGDKSYLHQWIRFRPGGGGKRPPLPFPQESLGFVVDMFPLLIEQYPGTKAQQRWYPTVALNMDIKRRLGEKDDWLYVRVRAGEIRAGRLDLQVIVLDRWGRLVVISSHCAMVLDASRNLAARGGGQEKGGGKGDDGGKGKGKL